MAANFPGANVAVPGVYGPTGSFVSVNDKGHSPIKTSESQRIEVLIGDTEQEIFMSECSKCGSKLRISVKDGNVTETQQYMNWSYTDNDVEKPQHCDALRMESAIG